MALFIGRTLPLPEVASSALETDWTARTSGPGVVWYHDFRSADEVDAFRWDGGFGNDPDDESDPGKCVYNPNDGITGGCLELIYPVGSSGAPGWWRPFAPMSAASSGKSVDDPAADGTMTLKAWDPSNTSENENFREAYYTHPSYVDAAGPNGTVWTDAEIDGHELWLQFRIKMDANRYLSEITGGKLSFLATTQSTLNQEIVSQNLLNRRALWYTNFGSSPDTGGSMGVNNGTKQPGGDYDECGQGGDCWEYADDEWVTWLYHLVPGTDGNKDTLFEAFAARPGATDYEPVFRQLNTINFSDGPSTGHPFGWNAFQPSNYMNGASTSVEWFQRYDQIIFSKDFIRCPQTEALWPDQLTAGQWAKISGPSPSLSLSATNVAEDVFYASATGFGSSVDSVWTAWNSHGFCPTLGVLGSYLAHGGGHGDYYGNEFYRFDVLTRLWTRYTERYDPSTDLSGTTGLYPDDSPGIPHTYGSGPLWRSRSAEMIIPRVTIDNGGESNTSTKWRPTAFNVLAKTYRSMAAESPLVASKAGAWAVYDPERDATWGWDGSSDLLKKYDCTAETSSTFDYPIMANMGPACYVPQGGRATDLVVWWGNWSGSSGHRMVAANLSSPDSASRLDVTPTGTGPSTGNAYAMQWSNALGCLLYFPSADLTNVYKIIPPATDWTGTWTWELFTDAGNSVSLPDPVSVEGTGGARILQKVHIAPYGDSEIIICAPLKDDAVYAMKVS